MSRTLRTVSILFLLTAALSACKKQEDGKKQLPPASGSGAAPLPDIPSFAPSDAGAGSGSAAGKPSEAAAPSTFTGTLVAREEVQVAAKGNGTINELTVDEGSRVKKGDLLFRLDSRDAQLMRRQAYTQLEGAKLQLKTAQRERDRIAGLVAQNAMPQQQLDALDSQVEAAKVQIAAAQNSIALTNKQIGDATVRAPMDGVVTHKLKSVGEYVTLMPPTPVLIVQDQATLELKFNVPDTVLTSAHIGDPVTISMPSMGKSRVAKITEIAPMVDPRTRTIELTAVLDNCDGALRPGLMAEVELGAKKDAAAAPACGVAAAPGKGAKTTKTVKGLPAAKSHRGPGPGTPGKKETAKARPAPAAKPAAKKGATP